MAVSVKQEALQLEAMLYGLAEKQGDPTLDEHISQTKACLERLTGAHDAALAAAVRPAVDLASSLAHFPDKSVALKEKRGEKRAIATLMASDEVASHTDLLEDLVALAELPDNVMHADHEDTAAFVVQKLVEEFESRQVLLDNLQALQSDRDAIQRTVSRKVESSGKLASMVNAINIKANEVLTNFSVDPVKLPHKQVAPRTDLPGPLYVLFSQFLGIKAIYEDKVQVEVTDSNSEVPGDQVAVTVPGPEESRTRPCTVCFGFSGQMNTVLAHSPTHPDLLSKFNSNDTGSDWPHRVTPVHRTGSEQPEVPISYKPFRWCQKLAGLELLTPPNKSLAEGQDVLLGRTAEGFVWRIQQLLTRIDQDA